MLKLFLESAPAKRGRQDLSLDTQEKEYKTCQNQKKSFHWCHQALHEALTNRALWFWDQCHVGSHLGFLEAQEKLGWWKSNKRFCTAGRAAVIPNSELHQPPYVLVPMGSYHLHFMLILLMSNWVTETSWAVNMSMEKKMTEFFCLLLKFRFMGNTGVSINVYSLFSIKKDKASFRCLSKEMEYKPCGYF